MEISIKGIEEAVGGLDYRSEKSPKSRLVSAIRSYYAGSEKPEEVKSIDGDRLIDIMWDLGGDGNAIRSKRKNLNAIKSSVNKDFEAAWEEGLNSEGVTIGPKNTFVMSDAAKEKILSSFSGSMNLDGGNSLDRVAEALKIVSEYLSDMPEGLENEQLSNLKSLVEGLSDKFREGDGTEFEIVRKEATPSVGAEILEEEGEEIEELEAFDEEVSADELAEEDEIVETVEGADADDVEEMEELGKLDEEVPAEELEETEIVETVDENDNDGETDDLYGEQEDETLDYDGEDIVYEEGDGELVELEGADALGDEDEIEVVYEDDLEDYAEEDTDDGSLADEEADEVAPETELEEIEVGEEDVIDELEDGEALGDDEAVDEEVDDGDDEKDLAESIDDGIEEMAEIDELEEADTLEEIEADEFDEVAAEDEPLEDVEEVQDVGGDSIELVGADGLEDADEVELVDDDALIEEMDGDFGEEDVEEVEMADVDDAQDDGEYEEVEEIEDVDDDVPETEGLEDGLGLPIDQLMESAQNLEEFQLDGEQKRLLAEQFDGYLGAMERYYNQYILIKRGSYPVGIVKPGFDVLSEQKVLMADYYMGKYPVTNALFEVFVERTGYKTTAEKLGYGYVYHGRFRKVVDPSSGFTSSVWNPTATREQVMGATWYQPLGPGSTLHKKRNHPVVQISVRDARTFAAWTGKRLPTEIEWEAAARSMTGNTRPWGNDWMEGVCNLENSAISDTCPVDYFHLGENEAGIADLLGNVLEWTDDECEPKYQMENPEKYFVAKGGSWISTEKTYLYDRNRFEADFTANILGFRCIAD